MCGSQVLTITFLVVCVLLPTKGDDSKDRYLSLPKLEKCNSRFQEAKYNGRNFFYSGHDPELKDLKVDWLDARNTCRERCMETVSFETQEKFDFFKSYVEQKNISFFWTSGRLCDFAGCEGRWDLLPKRIKGWLWSANQTPISPTNVAPPGWSYQPWSNTGIRKKPQPDNAEYYLSQTSEACLGILNNMYNDSVAWHDIACYHKTRFICEDSELLLKEVTETANENEAEEEKEMEPETTTVKREIMTTVKRRIVTTTESILKEEIGEKVEETTKRRTRKRKILRRKLVTNSQDETSTIKIDSTTVPSTTAETENTEVNEVVHAADFVEEEEKVSEEDEVTTTTDAPTTEKVTSQPRGRRRRPLARRDS